MLGLPSVPLVPLNPLPSSVTLLQVEDILAMSEMMWDLQSYHCPLPLLSSSNSPLSSLMVVDVKKDCLYIRSHALSFNPWMKSYLTLAFAADVLE
jgi:hypothetical protein